MAEEPATRLPEGDRANIRPDIPSLRTQEGIGTNTAGRSLGGASSSTAGRAGGARTSTPSEGGGASSSTGSSQSTNTGGLPSVAASEAAGNIFNPVDRAAPLKNRMRGNLGFLSTRAKLFGTGSLATIVAILLMIFTFSSGPFEFIHIAQLLGKDFASQEDAKDNRLTKMAQFIRDPSKPQNARVGLVGTAVATRLEKKLHDKTGLTPAFEEGGLAFGTGYTVDIKHENFQGKNTAELKKEVMARYSDYGITESDIKFSRGSNGKALVQIDTRNLGKGPISRYRAQTKLSRAVLRDAGYSKLAAHAGTRVEAARAGWTFHPIKKADQKIKSTALDLAKKGGQKALDKYRAQQKQSFIKQQVAYESGAAKPVVVSAQDKTAKDANGKATDPAAAADAQAASSEAGNVTTSAEQAAQTTTDGGDGNKQLSDKLRLSAASGVGLAGLMCIVNGLSQHIDQAKYDKAILPMMRKAGKVISLGSQAQSGKDISVEDLGNYSDFLNKKDANGKVVSTWNQSRAFQAQLNQPQSGPDIPKAGQVFEGNPVDFLDGFPGLSTVCGALGSPIGQVAMFITGPLNFIVGSKVTEIAINFASGWLSGSPVPATAAGADYGSYIKYGSKLLANDTFAAAGAAPMDTVSVKALDDTNKIFDGQDFQSKNIAYRIFNPNDSRTLASHIIDQQSGSNVGQDVASMVGNIGSVFSTALKIPSTIFGSITHAADKPYSYHGLKTVGFTPDELADSAFDNPFHNGCMVTGCHDKNTAITGIFEDPAKAQQYTDRAEKCFGVKITNDGTMWTIDSKTQAVNMYTKDYPEGECRSLDMEWKRVRFWLLDTATIEGYDCAGDTKSDTADQSCADVGVGAPASTATTPDSATTGADFAIKKLSPSIPGAACGCTINPTGITLHWWGNQFGKGIQPLVDIFKGNGLSVQVGITSDGEVYQMTDKLNSKANHAIGGNQTTIGIEIEGAPGDFGADGIKKYPKKFDAVVSTVKSLVKKYNIPLDGPATCDAVVGIHPHSDYNNCPGAVQKQDIDSTYLNEVLKKVKQ